MTIATDLGVPRSTALQGGPPVQSGARRDGIAGIYGNAGNVESVSYRLRRRLESPNPTLSAKFL